MAEQSFHSASILFWQSDLVVQLNFTANALTSLSRTWLLRCISGVFIYAIVPDNVIILKSLWQKSRKLSSRLNGRIFKEQENITTTLLFIPKCDLKPSP
jgi:hypothetical protein